MTPAALIAGTVPLAGLVMAASRREQADLFLIAYVAAVGLILSLSIFLDGLHGLTPSIAVLS